jgi:hypothetical protein
MVFKLNPQMDARLLPKNMGNSTYPKNAVETAVPDVPTVAARKALGFGSGSLHRQRVGAVDLEHMAG